MFGLDLNQELNCICILALSLTYCVKHRTKIFTGSDLFVPFVIVELLTHEDHSCHRTGSSGSRNGIGERGSICQQTRIDQGYTSLVR
jgi:hypothetical protein